MHRCLTQHSTAQAVESASPRLRLPHYWSLSKPRLGAWCCCCSLCLPRSSTATHYTATPSASTVIRHLASSKPATSERAQRLTNKHRAASYLTLTSGASADGKREAEASIHPLPIGLGASHLVSSPKHVSQPCPHGSLLTTLPPSKQTLHHHHITAATHPLRATASSSEHRWPHTTLFLSAVRHQRPASPPHSRRPLQEAARTPRDTALCVLDPPGTRHTKPSSPSDPGT